MAAFDSTVVEFSATARRLGISAAVGVVILGVAYAVTLIAPAICVGIVENATFNAIATRNNFREFIALYSGALTQLTMYAHQLFSDPALYPDIGDVSIEKSEPQIIERLKSADLAHAMALRYMPFCPIRKSVSEMIAESACFYMK